jgi:transposase-like protein
MTTKRRNHSAQFKFKVALEAARNEKTRAQIASEYGVQGAQISQWKKQLLAGGKDLFERKNGRKEKDWEAKETELYEQIGRLKMELEWLKKKSGQID